MPHRSIQNWRGKYDEDSLNCIFLLPAWRKVTGSAVDTAGGGLLSVRGISPGCQSDLGHLLPVMVQGLGISWFQ